MENKDKYLTLKSNEKASDIPDEKLFGHFINSFNNSVTDNETQYSKQYIIDLIKDSFATKIDLQKYQPLGDYVTQNKLNDYVVKNDLNNYQPKGDYALKNEMNNYQLKSEMTSQLSNYALLSDLSRYQLLNSQPTSSIQPISQPMDQATVEKVVKSI
jgi:hypothetical protein